MKIPILVIFWPFIKHFHKCATFAPRTEPVKVVAEEKLGHCPLCNQTFQLSKLEAHVDTCLDQQEGEDRTLLNSWRSVGLHSP